MPTLHQAKLDGEPGHKRRLHPHQLYTYQLRLHPYQVLQRLHRELDPRRARSTQVDRFIQSTRLATNVTAHPSHAIPRSSHTIEWPPRSSKVKPVCKGGVHLTQLFVAKGEVGVIAAHQIISDRVGEKLRAATRQ